MDMSIGWTWKVLGLCFFLLPILVCRATEKSNETADLILTNGNVITVEPEPSSVEALAVKGDRILALGTNEDLLGFRGESTTIIDLEGKTVIPGFIDSHMHFPLLGKRLKQIYLDETTSFAEVLEIVEKAIEQAKPGDWIMGSGWHTANWTIKAYPDNRRLSEISPDNPVFLSGMATHAALVNERVLELAGIGRETPDPVGGRILKDAETQEPTGLLLEKAQSLVTQIFPPETSEIKEEDILLSIQTALKMGLTSVHDAGVGSDIIQIYKRLLDEDRLDIRLYVMFLVQGDEPLLDDVLNKTPEIGLGNNHFTLRCIKFLIDGAMGARGAALISPYSDKPDQSGLVAIPEEEVYAIVKKCLASGYQVAMHAIGDRGNRIALNATEKALGEIPAKDPRIRIEHAQILALEDIPRFAKLGIAPSMQPIHCPMDKGFAEARIGKERMKGAYAWRSLAESGLKITGGSDVPDFPVVYSNPLWGIYAAVTRQDLDGQPEGGWYPEQRVDRIDALKMYTINGAYAAFEEDLKGSLLPGKLADLTILSNDILSVPTPEILQTEVMMTIIGGRIVYERSTSFHP